MRPEFLTTKELIGELKQRRNLDFVFAGIDRVSKFGQVSYSEHFNQWEAMYMLRKAHNFLEQLDDDELE